MLALEGMFVKMELGSANISIPELVGLNLYIFIYFKQIIPIYKDYMKRLFYKQFVMQRTNPDYNQLVGQAGRL